MDSRTRRAFIYATIVAMGGFVFGLDAALISGGVDLIKSEFQLSPEQVGIVVSAPGWGVLAALPFFGVVCNYLGRKKAILLISILYAISAVISAIAPNFGALAAARFVGGVGWCSITLASMYIGEIAPPRWRGKLVSMTQINIVIGLFGAYFVTYLIHQLIAEETQWLVAFGATAQNEWRWMLGAEIPVCILWTLLLGVIPESPYWLIYAGRSEQAKQSLSKIIPLESIDAHVEAVQASISAPTGHRSNLQELLEIFSRPMMGIFVIALTIAIAQQSSGINAVLFYAQTIFKQLGIGEDAAFVQAVWVGLTSVVFTVLGLMLVDKLGRRPLIMWGMVWIIASLGLCAVAFQQARYSLSAEAVSELQASDNPIAGGVGLSELAGVQYNSDIEFRVALREKIGDKATSDNFGRLLESAIEINSTLVLLGILSFIAAYHFSIGPVMWVLFSEIFPGSVRGMAIPFFAVISSLTSALVQFFFPRQLETMGMSTIFLTYAGTILVGLIILFFTLKETKNMSIEEIENALIRK